MTPRSARRRVSVPAVAAGAGVLSYALTWTAPLSPGGTIDGYTIRWGTSPTALPYTTTTSGTGTTYTIPNLTAGTWYVTLATIVGGVESDQGSPFAFTV